MLNRYLFAPLAALLLLAAPRLAHAQTGSVGIGTTAPDASAALDVSSTSKGLLPPRLSTAQRDAIASPAAGLTIFNTTTNKLNTWNGTGWDAALSATEQPSLTGPSQTFIYTGKAQTYIVPAGVILLDVDARGSCGSFGSSGGAGGRVQTTLTVVPGEVLTLYVGGYTGRPTFNGGGANGSGGVGGGATDLRRAPAGLADRLVVAGGGGGSTRNGAPGGAGGGLTGGTGGNDGGIPGGGGSQTAGGSAGGNAGAGSLGQGGNGDSGGGGGYYGGGGGYVSAGGGGSSYVVPTGSRNTTHTQGFNRSDGSITLTVVALTYAAPALDGTNFVNVPGDNLGNHTATQNLNLADKLLTGNGGTAGLAITSTGNVGLGTTTAQPATQKLDVRGNVRLGDDGGNVGGTGQAIEFVGPGFSTDPVGVYRVNPAADQSELRVVVGDVPDANDKFVVGRMAGTTAEGGIPTGTFTPTFSVNAAGQVNAPGLASIGTRMVTADATGTLVTQALPTDAQQLSISGSTLALTNGGSVTLPAASGDNLGNHTATQALKLGTNALVGNNGTTGLTITAAGSARLLAANAYTYAAAKPYVVTYSISDMQPEAQATIGKQRILVNNAEYTYASSALRIPVHLPEGATITGIKCYALDSDGSRDVAVYFVSVLPTDTGIGAAGPFSNTASSSGAPGFTTFSFTPASPVINNNQAYFLVINADSDSRAIGAIRISYTVTQAE